MEHRVTDPQQKITAAQGDTISVELEESPTTFYRWELESTDGNVQLQSSNFNPHPGGAIGGGGVRKITFRAVNRGAGQIRLKHWQPSTHDIDKRFDAQIEVK